MGLSRGRKLDVGARIRKNHALMNPQTEFAFHAQTVAASKIAIPSAGGKMLDHVVATGP
jgi:hypothetical protein